MIKEIHVYDVDGTIVCSMHRYRLKANNKIDLQHWRDNQHLAYKDSLLPLAEQYKAHIKDPEIYVIIATARVLRDVDYNFIFNVLGTPNHIISRNGDDDTRSGAKMKITGLNKIFNLKQFQNIKKRFFYEDNKDYLYAVADYHNMKPIYVPSMQGY